MLSFIDYLTEKVKYHHTLNWGGGDRPHNDLKPKGRKKPIWLSNTKKSAANYDRDSHGGTTHRVKVKGKVAHYKDKKVKKLLKKHGIGKAERRDFHDDARGGMYYHDLPQDRLPQVLRKKGYAGYTHPEDDYEGVLKKKKHRTSTMVFRSKDAKLKKKPISFK